MNKTFISALLVIGIVTVVTYPLFVHPLFHLPDSPRSQSQLAAVYLALLLLLVHIPCGVVADRVAAAPLRVRSLPLSAAPEATCPLLC